MFQTNLYMSNYLHLYWRLRSLLFIYYQFIFIDIYSSFVESVFLYLFHCVLPASNWLVQSHERDDEEVNTRKKSLLEKLRYLADRIHPPQIADQFYRYMLCSSLNNFLFFPAAGHCFSEMEEAYSELYQQFLQLRSLCLRQAALLHQLTETPHKQKSPNGGR